MHRIKVKVLKIFLAVAIALFGVFANINSVLAVSVNVDFTQSQGPFQKYNQYVNRVWFNQGPLDSARVKDAGINLEHVFYSLRTVAPERNVRKWESSAMQVYGDDGIIRNVMNNGAKASIAICPRMPDWLGWNTPTYLYNDRYNVPENHPSWPDYENLVYETLGHFKANNFPVEYISLFEEADSNANKINGIHFCFYPIVWGVNGEMYNRFYLHTSNAVLKFNQDNNTNFKLVGPTPLLWSRPTEALALMVDFLDFMKEKRDQGIPLKVDAVSWDHYQYDPFDDTINSVGGFLKAVDTELNNRGFFNMPLHIKEWANPLTLWSEGGKIVNSSARIVASWKTMMDTGLEIYPFYWDLSENMLPARYGNAMTGTNLPDGTVTSIYNVFKMMNMQKITRYKANSTIANVYPLASGDTSGAALMVSSTPLT